MIGKITSSGNLQISRNNSFVACDCPFNFEQANCGHWCPMFGEIESASQYNEYRINICHGQQLVFETLTDER